MRKTLTFLLLFASTMLIAQNYSYYNGKKQPLELSKKSINIFVTNQFVPPPDKEEFNEVHFTANELNTNEKWATLHFANELSDVAFYQKVNELKNC
jgi:hypothetical protein